MLTSTCLEKSSEKNCLRAFVVTLGATEWFFTSMSSFMSLQSTFLAALVVTLGAAERIVTSMSSLMVLQTSLLCECFVTIAAKDWDSSFTSLHVSLTSVRVGLR